MNTIVLFNKKFVKTTLSEFVRELGNVVEEKRKVHIHTVNIDHLVIASKNIKFNSVMKNADYLVADGMPIVWYSKLRRKNLPERITGVDLCYSLVEHSKEMGLKIFLLGAKEGIGIKAKEELEKKYRDAQIVGVYSPGHDEINDLNKNNVIIDTINKSGANVLFVALGAPKQEIWIYDNLSRLHTNINVGVGATLDFMSGEVSRAPKFFQNIGLEWFYRMIKDPKRLVKRYLVQDLYFFKLIIKDIFHGQKR
ncbi:WecB/TagA/CpsF family glycosyltransferase [Heyndrickxia coagulans]|uniref:WecB/TagA/CpsF family glycosyltransferase n=1 Tax=Heyndrickxia coagulans TaxID=1398 RepID=UPI000308B23C|nr:WecB/TagA/CpsF family glycosyltransferase [Heyndrickxia coagulans]